MIGAFLEMSGLARKCDPRGFKFEVQHDSHSHRGFSPVLRCPADPNRFNGLWCETDKKTVETVQVFEDCFDTGLKPQCE